MSASKWKRYPNYSEKGIDWLGEVPEHWDISTPRLMFEEIKDKNTDSERTNFLSLVSKKGIIPYEEKGSMGNKMSVNIDHYTLVNKGDFVLNSMNFGIGGFGVSPYDGITSPAYVVLRPDVEENLTSYLSRIFEDEGFQKGTAILGDGILELRRAIGWKHLKRQPIPIPTLEERIAIARFLESGLDDIDELILALQNMLVKLEEKRSALITQAVTKGLNPNLPMKDSGINWIGEIPKHWKSGSLGYYSTMETGSTPNRGNSKYWTGDIPWVKTGEINYQDISATEETISELGLKESSCKIIKPDTLLMALYGQGATRGRVAVLSVPATCNQACAAVSPTTDVNVRFLEKFLFSAYNHIRTLGNQTTQPNLNLELIRKIRILVPPLDEQNEITFFCDQTYARISELISKTESKIKKLAEYRTSLVSAAVTGKIDVRESI